ncbi:MAG TPA: alpha/beta hydrolase-fold protein [Cyclobacteriaceae bacterium]|nr:alpha/beta hydrolase-fold protein [Cyclobacteriaceae bacterium]
MRAALLLTLLTSFLELTGQDIFLEVPTRVKDIKLENLKSSYGQDYLIYINLPDDYEKSTKSYPIFFILDPDVYFIGATNIYKKAVEQNGLEQSIVVGIGYGHEPKPKRFKDYSPTFQKDYPGSGNSENFRIFIEDILFPFLNKNYRTNGTRTIYGHSLGGLFACYVLFTKPTMFRNYIISSPSAQWDNGIIFSYEDKYFAKSQTINAKTYFSIGDEKDGKKEFDKLIDRLKTRKYEGLKIKREDFPTKTHQTVIPHSLTNGISFILNED